jgi:hypothetical protein
MTDAHFIPQSIGGHAFLTMEKKLSKNGTRALPDSVRENRLSGEGWGW